MALEGPTHGTLTAVKLAVFWRRGFRCWFLARLILDAWIQCDLQYNA